MKPLFFGLSLLSPVAWAANSSVPDMSTWLTASFGVVLLILLLAWILKKAQLTPNVSGQIKVIATLAVGSKERLLVVELNKQQYFLGITQQKVTLLEKLEIPLEAREVPEFSAALQKFLKKR